MARRQDEQGQDYDADQGQSPFQPHHDRQHGNCLDDVGQDADDGVANGILSSDHVVVQAAHQLAHFGIGKEAQ